MQDFHLLEKLAHFNRERIPERVVHAKGAGAFGYFEVTHAASQWTKAKFLSDVGKRTPLFIRFSTVGGEKGSADTERDPRGFAMKFYTEDGNYDLVGNNTPVFFIRDPLKFPDFIHTQKRNPATNCKDPNMVWDFFSLSPESMHQLTILFSDRGTPKSYRNMHGFGSHTFSWINAEGQRVWVKYHIKSDQGIQNFTREEAVQMAGQDPDYATRDLFNAIAQGDHPSWTVSVQVMPFDAAYSYSFDPFDVTKVWHYRDYPLQPIGRIVLDRNPQNYFADVEQAAFSPANVVPGIGFSPDKLLQGRLFAYADTHRYRLGVNHALIPVNRPINEVSNHQRDGAMRTDSNGSGTANYEPNSFGGPTERPADAQPPLPVSGVAGSHPYIQNDHYTQPGDLYRLMTPAEKARLVSNIAASMETVDRPIQLRQIVHFARADRDYGQAVASALGLSVDEAFDASTSESVAASD